MPAVKDIVNRLCRLLVAVLAVGAASAVENWRHLQPASQTGPSCGFFANIPALTLTAGVDISTSPAFVSAVYGLRRGDFHFQRSYDKRLFFEMFGLPWEETTILHRQADAGRRIAAAEEIIRTRFIPGLAAHRVYSLRVRGILGGPHNVLLLARDGEKLVVHNPYPGSIRALAPRELAEIMVVRSTAKANEGKNIHLSSWLEILLPAAPSRKPIPLSALPAEIRQPLPPAIRRALADAMRPRIDLDEAPRLRDLVEAFPALDFAALPPLRKGGAPIPAIDPQVPAKDLKGLLWLAKFHLANWQARRATLLPVWILDHRPWVLTGYQPIDHKDANLSFDNGREVRWLPASEALEIVHAGGSHHATIHLGLPLEQP
jgi:hypothetical protein